eukprot:191409-Amphidinium_carterae.1
MLAAKLPRYTQAFEEFCAVAIEQLGNGKNMERLGNGKNRDPEKQTGQGFGQPKRRRGMERTGIQRSRQGQGFGQPKEEQGIEPTQDEGRTRMAHRRHPLRKDNSALQKTPH